MAEPPCPAAGVGVAPKTFVEERASSSGDSDIEQQVLERRGLVSSRQRVAPAVSPTIVVLRVLSVLACIMVLGAAVSVTMSSADDHVVTHGPPPGAPAAASPSTADSTAHGSGQSTTQSTGQTNGNNASPTGVNSEPKPEPAKPLVPASSGENEASPAQPASASQQTSTEDLTVLSSDSAIRFVALADWGAAATHGAVQGSKSLRHTISTHNAEFVLCAGDNFYMNGVLSSADPRFKQQFTDVWHTGTLPWWLVQGNHDYKGYVEAQIHYHYRAAKDPRWNMPGFQWTHQWTTTDGLTMQVIGIDIQRMEELHYDTSRRHINRGHYSKPSAKECHDWLVHALECSTADWLIVMGHDPARSDGKRGATPWVTRVLTPLMIKYGVNLYISGHEHHMAHMIEPGSHLNYMIVGNGCSADKVRRKSAFQKFALAKVGHAAVTITPCTMTLDYIDATKPEDQAVVYTTEIPNYRRAFLSARDSVEAHGECPEPPTDPNLAATGGKGSGSPSSEAPPARPATCGARGTMQAPVTGIVLQHRSQNEMRGRPGK